MVPKRGQIVLAILPGHSLPASSLSVHDLTNVLVGSYRMFQYFIDNHSQWSAVRLVAFKTTQQE
jgi:hypothetical protein